MRVLAQISQNEGVRIGLIATIYGFGLRHGVDWDHIAAITDITSSQDSNRTSMLFATLYALGHGLVVFLLGTLAIALGDLLPDRVDALLERVVGATLLLLGVYVFYSLIRHGRDFRMRSRWMLVFSGVRRGSRWVRERIGQGGERSGDSLEHEHEHVAGTPHHDEVETPAATLAAVRGRSHRHQHRHPSADDAFMNYGRATSFVVGMIHGVGAETPTQVLIFLTAAGAAGSFAGIILLLVFILGLVTSNSAIALSSTLGYLAAGRSWGVYAAVAVITGFFSLVLGVLFLFGRGTLLPAIFGG